jgi:hypothetical protein
VKFVFRNETKNYKIESVNSVFLVSDFVSVTWMLRKLGEGELEIENQGWSRVYKVFSQETGAIGQHPPRIGDRPKLKSLQVQDARFDSDSTPHLFRFFLGKKQKKSGVNG